MNELIFTPGNVLENLFEWQNSGLKVALVTLINVDGRSPYPVGTQMGVSECGRYCGYLTSGCAEKAIIQQSIDAITRQNRSSHRYGKGSPYFDIVLPCGSGIDVLIDPLLPHSTIKTLVQKIDDRLPVWLSTSIHAQSPPQLSGDKLTNEVVTSRPSFPPRLTSSQGHSYLAYSNPKKETFWQFYPPKPKMIIAGQGPIVAALSQLALQAGFSIEAYFDDPQSDPHINHKHFTSGSLATLTTQKLSSYDEYTAFVSLLHEHDKESQFLIPALKSHLFYIGALGSKTTHATRCDLLKAMSVNEENIRKIHGPIGFPLKAKTPVEIAISILSEIISVKNKQSKSIQAKDKFELDKI